MNKQLADHHIQTDPRQSRKIGMKQNDDLDDLRSEQSFQTSQSSIMGRSNFSSAIKKGPSYLNTPGMGHTNMHDVNSSVSQISVENEFANAEYKAIEEEMVSKQRKEQQERKLQEFQERTKKNAQKKLKEEIKQRERQEIERQMKDRERMVKARDYAKKQRSLIENKTSKRSKMEVLSQSEVSQDPAGAHTNFHANFNKVNNDVIQEVSEAEERTHIDQTQSFQQLEEVKPREELDLRELYMRIDQEELEKLGVGDKQDISEQAFQDLHEYSQLQRFRQNKDLKAIDKSSKTKKKGKGQEDKENKWWLENDTQKKAEMKSQVEKGRYLKALKALVYEKGGKLEGGEIPNLCSCGALGENLKEMKRGNKGSNVQMCASNCQFYKNEKDYEKAMRDILHSISLFK